jgi:hypothetical protein
MLMHPRITAYPSAIVRTEDCSTPFGNANSLLRRGRLEEEPSAPRWLFGYHLSLPQPGKLDREQSD